MKNVIALAVLFALVLGLAPAATATDPVYVAPAAVVTVKSADACDGTCAPAAAALGYGAAQPFQLLAVPTYNRADVQAFNAYGANANAVRVQTVRVQNVQPAAVVRVQNVHVQPAAVVRVQNVQAHAAANVVNVKTATAGANAVRVQSAGNSNIKVQVNNGNQRQGLFGRLLNR